MAASASRSGGPAPVGSTAGRRKTGVSFEREVGWVKSTGVWFEQGVGWVSRTGESLEQGVGWVWPRGESLESEGDWALSTVLWSMDASRWRASAWTAGSMERPIPTEVGCSAGWRDVHSRKAPEHWAGSTGGRCPLVAGCLGASVLPLESERQRMVPPGYHWPAAGRPKHRTHFGHVPSSKDAS